MNIKVKELGQCITQELLRKTLGRLPVAEQYRIGKMFGFKITDAYIQPAHPENHLPVKQSPDELLVARGTIYDNEIDGHKSDV